MRSIRGDCGSSLIECMLAASLSACAVFAAISMLIAANAAFVSQQQSALLQENGRYAVTIITRALHQLSYVDYSLTNDPDILPALQGQDNSGVNGSDLLTLHFAGSGLIAGGNVINCAGFSVPSTPSSMQPDQGWSIFYIARNTQGEPELRCKYRGSEDWSSQALVAGVESFQVLYGVDKDADGVVDQYLNATSVTGQSLWNQVVALRIALLLRAERDAGGARLDRPDYFVLFGTAYDSASDPGTRIMRASLPAVTRQWPRLVVQSTIYLRNTLQPQGRAP